MTRFVRPLGETERPEPADDADGEGSPGTALARLVGAIGLVLLTAVLFWLLTDDDFRVTEADVDITGVQLADPAAVRDHIGGIDRAPNIFRLRAGDIVEDLGALPEVAFASASVSLPASVSVEVVERVPMFIWSNGGEAWLVDEEGVLFRPRETALPTSPGEVSDGDAYADLPLLEDARLVDEPFVAGDRLPAIDIAAMRRLLAIDPAFLGSDAAAIRLRIDDRDGYVLQAVDQGWNAVFGHYRGMVQPPDVIARQLQCLTSLLATRPEKRIERIVLVPAEGRCGTFRSVGSREADA